MSNEIIKICEYCKKQFITFKYLEIRKKYCCKDCFNKSKKGIPSHFNKQVILLCKYCNNNFKVKLSRIDKAKYCSHFCRAKNRTGERCYQFKGIPKCIDCGNTLSGHKSTRCVKCSGKMKSGENHYLWKGGHSVSGNKKIRESLEYKTWRLFIFDRDNYTCQMPECWKRGGELQSYHIKMFVKYPEERFNVNNGITLCKKCHNKIRWHEDEFEHLFKAIILEAKIG